MILPDCFSALSKAHVEIGSYKGISEKDDDRKDFAFFIRDEGLIYVYIFSFEQATGGMLVMSQPNEY